MKDNKFRWIILILFVFAFILLLLGITFILQNNQSPQSDELDQIVNAFNYQQSDEQEIKLSAERKGNTSLVIYSSDSHSYIFILENHILRSQEYLEEKVALQVIDTILKLQTNGQSFLRVFNMNTINDYTLEDDGIEILKQENTYRLAIHLKKEIREKESLDSPFTIIDYQKDNLKEVIGETTYYRKGYIIIKKYRDSFGQEVIVFAQSLDNIRDSLRKSIASYLSFAKNRQLGDEFLTIFSLEDLQNVPSSFSENILEKEYLVLAGNEKDSYFDSYFEMSYKTMVLVLK